MKAHHLDIGVRLAAEGVVRLCGLATLPVLTRTLGRDGYGVVVGTGSICGVFTILAVCGLSYHVGRIVGRGESPQARRLLRRLLLIATLTGGVWAAVTAAAAPWLDATFLKQPDARAAFLWCAGMVLFTAWEAIFMEWVRQRGRYRTLSILLAAMAVVQLAAVLVVATHGGGPAEVVACAVACQAIRIALLALLIRLSARATDTISGPSADADLPTLRRCVTDGAVVMAGSLGTWGLAQAGRLFLGNANGMGGMGVAAALASMPVLAGAACGQSLFPDLVRAVGRRRRRDMIVAVRRFAGSFWILTIPAMAIALPLAGEAAALLGGRDFNALGPTCVLMLAAAWMEMAVLPMTYSVSAHGWATRSRNAALAGAVVNLGAAVVLVPRLGTAGVALAALSGQLAFAGLLAWGLRQAGFPWAALLPKRAREIIAVGLAGTAIAAAIPHRSWPGMVVAAGVPGVLMLAVLFRRQVRTALTPRTA